MIKQACFLIDDDEDDREIFGIALEDAAPGFECITAKNGLEAMELLNTGNFMPSHIFVDLNMPYMSGIECLQAIKHIPALATVPVIMYTTSSHNKDIEESRALGASHYLIKPTSLTTLIELLSGIFKKTEQPYVLGYSH
ncbi:MAG TPA: response regulator [Flavobacterium sp.]|nr:response regulator [Flavobacterium sp.]